MNLAVSDRPRPGLRERKKAKTRALLQEQALRLFREQGYEATTVQQIAEAAEVSPTTVYRYFPNKSDLVIYDDLDERLLAAFRAQPPELGALEAMRGGIRTAFGALTGAELAVQRERERLMRAEPELRAAMLDEFTRTQREIAELIAERAGRAADDETVQLLAGAGIGIAIAAWFGHEGDDWTSLLDRIDRGLALLESGVRL